MAASLSVCFSVLLAAALLMLASAVAAFFLLALGAGVGYFLLRGCVWWLLLFVGIDGGCCLSVLSMATLLMLRLGAGHGYLPSVVS